MYRLYGQRCSRWTPSSAICSSLRCFRRDDRIELYCLNGRQSGRQRSNLRKYCIDYIFIMSAAADLKQPRYSRSLVCGQRRSQGTPPSANSLLRWLRLAAKPMRCTRAVSPLMHSRRLHSVRLGPAKVRQAVPHLRLFSLQTVSHSKGGARRAWLLASLNSTSTPAKYAPISNIWLQANGPL